MKHRTVIILLCVCLFPIFSVAQGTLGDSTYVLPAVEVMGDRVEVFASGHFNEKIDSMALREGFGQSLSDLLAINGLLFLKANGPSGIASVSMRGTSANHTAVLWNGMNIQSPMNGGVDLSLLPLGMTDEVSIQYGGGGALQGSGAVGGSVLLQRKPAFSKGFLVETGFSAGSFLNLGGDLKIEYGSERSYTALRAFYHYGKNDFRFTNYTLPIVTDMKQTHAHMQQYGVMAAQDIAIRKFQRISFDLLYLKATRELPPLMIQALNAAILDDQSLRTRLEWSDRYKNATFFVRTALLKDNQNYSDSITHTDAYNDYYSWVSEIETRLLFRKCHLVNLGIQETWESISSNNYIEDAGRNRLAFIGSYLYQSKKETLSVSASVRLEYAGGILLSPAPSAGMDLKLWRGGQLNLSGSRVFRLPTFNDLYWNPGGNLDLKPETGWSEEAGLSQIFGEGKAIFTKLRVNVFNSNISNWILWLPEAGLWSPRNIMQVWARGIEVIGGFNLRFNKFSIALAPRYTYTRSTSQKATSPGDASMGKQLVYTPEHSAACGLSFRYLKYSLNYTHTFIGKRYLSSDNLDDLPAYHLGNISLSGEINHGHSSWMLAFSIENLWNVEWQSIVWMPMPGRSYHVNIRYNFHKPFKSKTL